MQKIGCEKEPMQAKNVGGNLHQDLERKKVPITAMPSVIS